MQELSTNPKKQPRSTLQIRLDENLREKFRARAKERGLNESAVLRLLIMDFVENPQGRLIY